MSNSRLSKLGQVGSMYETFTTAKT